MDIFEFALEKEQLAHETYKKLAQTAPSDSLRGILNLLADEELKHVDMVRALQQNQAVEIPATQLLGEAKKVFEKISTAGENFNFNISESDLYKKARQIELDARDYYNAQAEKTDNEELKSILTRLATEEQKHYVLVDNLCQFIERPQSYLEDAEFNHLDNYAEEPM
jgi:rubrerythrin